MGRFRLGGFVDFTRVVACLEPLTMFNGQVKVPNARTRLGSLVGHLHEIESGCFPSLFVLVPWWSHVLRQIQMKLFPALLVVLMQSFAALLQLDESSGC